MARTSYFNDYPNLTGTVAPAGALQGAEPTEGSGTPYGQVPSVPSPGTTSIDALLANINNLANIGQLGSGLTAQGSANAMQPYTAALPGLAGQFGQAMGNIGAMQKGQIPQDVINLMQQQAAERGVATGAPGSPNTNAAYLRALGLTSLGLQNQGLANLRTTMGMVPTGPQFNPMSMLLSPEGQQGWQYLANVLRAAPSPGQAAQANLGAFQSGLGQGYGAGGGQSQLQSFLNSMDQWAKQGWAAANAEPSWQSTHPGMTPGFPNPTTTVPDTTPVTLTSDWWGPASDTVPSYSSYAYTPTDTYSAPDYSWALPDLSLTPSSSWFGGSDFVEPY